MFEEIDVKDFPKIDTSLYPYYFLDNYLPPDKLFKYNEFYIELILDGGIPFLSMINLGKPVNLICLLKPFIVKILDEYGIVGFQYDIKGTDLMLKRIFKSMPKIKMLYYTDEYGYTNLIVRKEE